MNQLLRISVLLLSLVSISAGQEPENVRWKLNAGDLFEATLEQKTEITTNIETRQKRIGNDMSLVIDWQVDQVEGNRIEMTQSINRIKLELRRPNETATETILVDTDATENPSPGLASELKAQIAPLIGTKFNVVMTTRGEILELSIPEDSKVAIRQAPASMLLRQVLTQEGMKEIFGQSSIVFPESIDDKEWRVSTQLNNAMGKISKEMAFKYQGRSERNDQVAHEFTITAKAKPLEGAKSADSPVMDDYSGTGKAWFSPDAKITYESEFENQMSVTRRYRDQKIVSSVSTTNKLRVVRK